jgi:hypothetical protein
MSMITETGTRPAEGLRVTRSQRNVAWTGIGALIVVAVLAMFPYIVYSGTTTIMVQAFIVLTMASMWNLLAGYAGLVSVGQQAFVGLGAYFVLILAIHGISPFAARCWSPRSAAAWRPCRCGGWSPGCAAGTSRSPPGCSPRPSCSSSRNSPRSAAGPACRCPACPGSARRCSPRIPTGRGWRSRCWRWPPCTCCCAAGSGWCSRPSATTRWLHAAAGRGSAWPG